MSIPSIGHIRKRQSVARRYIPAPARENYVTYPELDALTRQLMAQGKSDPANAARRAFFVKRDPSSKLERNRRRRQMGIVG